MGDDKARCPSIKKDIVLREEDDGAFLFDPIQDRLQALNETGVFVFKELNGKNSVDDIVKNVLSQYSDVESGTVKKDVEEFIEQIKTRGFLSE
ncbi:MAG: PqqD family protein [Deltaproteobacteria bacterium]|uniref:PqqD family protein n=1 Tax=Candidatus Zymogenus saltonus TaxID=2844893 RepID=A0A9D8KER6_9DELT|nr:PqqD family protein [Candidatus Zymogenus saltonus]